MIRSKKVRGGGIRATLAWTLILMLLVHSSAAAEGDCTVEDRYGEPRDCTFTEELAECALDAEDSLEQCQDNADGYLDLAVCGVTHIADNAACVIATPIAWGLGKLL